MSTLYDILTVLPFSLLALLLFGEYAGIPETGWPGIVLCTVFTAACVILRNLKPKQRLLTAGITAAALLGLLLAVGEKARERFAEEYLWILWIAGFSAAALLLGMLMQKYVWCRRVASAALLIYAIAETVQERNIRREVFALICLILLHTIAEEVQRKWEKSGSPEMKGHITRISPFLLAVCLIVYAVPAPDHPYDWQLFRDIGSSIASYAVRIYGTVTHPSEEYEKIGFSENGGFSAGLSENDEEVLHLHADNTTVHTFRLIGGISSNFTGTEWDYDMSGESRIRMTDTMETVCAVRKFAPDVPYDYLQDADLYYENRSYNTKYIFAPAKIQLTETQTKIPGISDRNGSIISEKKLRYQDSYQVACYMLNYGNPKLPELLRTAEPITEEEWKQTQIAERVKDLPGFSYADYQQYREDVYRKNCRPFRCSEQVLEILGRIQDGAADRYETLKRLEAYLSGMEYSLTDGALPETVTDAGTYLDYFLLTARKGRCSHFATAFVLMANEMGIPCRYVHGYLTTRDADGNMTVTQNCAHAWPEAYFDNVGWIIFEPTPGYADQSGWGIRESNTIHFEIDTPEPEQTEPAETAEEPAQEPHAFDPMVAVIPSLAAAGFLLLFFFVSRLVSRRKYAQMQGFEKYRYLAQQNLRLMGYLGFPKAEDETLSEYYGRMQQTGREDLTPLLGFLPVYEAALYSDRETGGKDIEAAEEIRRRLRSLVKKHKLRYRLLLLLQKG